MKERNTRARCGGCGQWRMSLRATEATPRVKADGLDLCTAPECYGVVRVGEFRVTRAGLAKVLESTLTSGVWKVRLNGRKQLIHQRKLGRALPRELLLGWPTGLGK